MTDTPPTSHPDSVERSDDRIDPELYGRYLTGELTPEERASLDRWATTPHRQRLLTARQDVGAPAPPDAARAANALSALRRRMRASRTPGRTRLSRWPSSRNHRGALWSVAAMAVALLVTLGAYLTHRTHPVAATRVYATTIGQRATVELPDGSRIIMAPNSRLEIAQDFGAAARMVTLLGEAYFTVTTKHDAPFIVRTGTIETRVLGTAFDVRRYAEDTIVRAAVTSGRIAMRNWRTTVHVEAGDVGLVTDSSATVVASSDVQSTIGWTQGRLVFTDTPVPALLATLGRWYGYEFTLSDSTLATQYVTATFDVEKPREALLVLKEMLGVTMTVDGSRVTLRSTAEHPHPAPARHELPHGRAPFTEIGR